MTNTEVLRESVANQFHARQHLCWSQLVFSRFVAIEWNPLAVFSACLTSGRVNYKNCCPIINANEDIRAPIAWFSPSAKLSAQLSPLPVHSTSHEIVFKAPLPYVIIYVSCAKIYSLQQRRFSTRNAERNSFILTAFGLVFNKMLPENAPLRLLDV